MIQAEILPAEKRSAAWPVVLIAATWALGSGLLLAFRSGFPFPPFDQLDTWFYTSYAWNLRGNISEFGPTYYGARISWLFPAAALHEVLPPALANIVLKLGFSALITLALSSIAWFVSGWRLAWLAAGIATCSPQIIAALHGDYTDTAVLAYSLVAVAAILRARDSRYRHGWIFIAGIFYTLMAISNLGAIANIGIGIALLHLGWIRQTIGRQAVMLGTYSIAAVITVVLLQQIHTRLGGTWNILEPQWRMVARFNREGTSNQWYDESWLWTVRATWLVIPFGATLWGAWAHFRGDLGSPRQRELLLTFTATLAAAIGIGFLLQFRGAMVLGLHYYAISLLCLALPLLLILVSLSAPERGRTAVVFGLSMLAMVLLILSTEPLFYVRKLKWFRALAGDSQAFLWIAVALVMPLGLLAGLRPVRRTVSGPIGATLLVVALIYLSMPRYFHHFSYADRLQERYLAVHAAHRYVTETFPENGYRFWIDRSFSDATSLGSTKLWRYRLYVQESFPQIDDPVEIPKTIIIPAPSGQGEEALAIAREQLGKGLVDLISPRIERISPQNDIGFDLVMFELGLTSIDPQDPPEGFPLPRMIAGLEYFGPNNYTRELSFFNHNGGYVELEQTENAPIFHRTTDHDYAYIPQRPLPPSSATRRLGFVFHFNQANHCTVIIEDNFYRQLHLEEFAEAGRYLVQVQIPHDVETYRLRFYARGVPSTPLPTNVNIYQIFRHAP